MCNQFMQLSNNRGEASTERRLADSEKVGTSYEAVKAVSWAGNILVGSPRPASVSPKQNWQTINAPEQIHVITDLFSYIEPKRSSEKIL